MSNQNGNYQWRPNDNSVTTNLRYDLEMNHWLKSFQSSTMKSTFKFSSSFIVIGLIFSLAINIIFFILICFSDLLVWTVNKIKKSEVNKPRPSGPPIISQEELDEMFSTTDIIRDNTT